MAKKRRIVKIRAPDLISKLPDHVIHYILSFLPTIDAVRMSLLSRRWRRMWYSIPALKFDDYQIKEELFFNFVEQCMKHHQMGMQVNTTSVITRFELRISRCRVDSSQVDRWLSFVAQPHLKELDVKMHALCSWSESPHCLPQVALTLTSLTILNLDYMKLEDCSHVNLPCLKSMSLTSSLKFLHIDGGWERIQVEAINLESLVYIGYGEPPCDFDLASCKQLTHLSMTGAYFDCDGGFENIISGFPLLESLTVKGYDLVDIRHQYLKVLVLEKYSELSEVKCEISIDAPNLVSFGYNVMINCYKLL
ncbi:hypothetical protein TIFTF001_022478 [Ficus carica]|uniref:F-box domain-containing protein n=1 Tax=Ficus carica TaxID=3494 RepID=A0AA88ATL9_FICCA|nr:hypothetical protein TIFTF001_022478 [Ficus carica]